jgi:hypothetical protein
MSHNTDIEILHSTRRHTSRHKGQVCFAGAWDYEHTKYNLKLVILAITKHISLVSLRANDFHCRKKKYLVILCSTYNS